MPRKKLNIVLLPDGLYPNNRSLIVEVWYRGLKQKGHKINTFMPSLNKYINPSKGVKLIFFPLFRGIGLSIIFRLFYPFLLFFELNNFFKKNKVDLIQVRNSIINSLVGLYFSRKYKIPFCFLFSSLHAYSDKEIDFIENSRKSQLFYEFIRYINCKLYDYILSNSSLIQPISKSMGKQISKKNSIAHYFPMPLSSSLDFTNNKKYPVSYDILRIIYSGCLNKSRNIHFLIEIAESLVKLKVEFNMLIIGKSNDNFYLSQIIANIREKNLENFVKVKEQIPYSEVPRLLDEYNIGLSPLPPIAKHIPSTPTKILEYMSSGLFTISNREIIDQRDIAVSSGSGFSVNYEVKSFVKVLNFLSKNKKYIHLNSIKGETWIKKNRSYSFLVDSLEKKYFSLL